MNSRERVLTAMNHVKPDRTPVDLYAVEEVWDKLRRHYKSDDDDRILETLDVDCK